jgi:hypothetical protein
VTAQKKQRKEELHYIHFSPKIVGIITSRVGWAWHVARIRQKRKRTWFSLESQEENYFEGLGVEVRII